MNIATWAIREPIPPIVLFLVFTLAGILAFDRLTIKEFPDTELPVITVTAAMEGASPSQLETEVTRKIENAVAGIEGIESLTSTITEGVSLTVFEFALESNQSETLDDVRAAVTNIRSDLPRDLEPPIVNDIGFSSTPILTYTVASETMDEGGLSWFIDDAVTRKLTAVPGVVAVNRLGGVQREILVELDPVKLAALELTAIDVSRQLRLAQRQLSGGRGEIGDARQSLRTIATVAHVKELEAFDIALPGGRHFRLDQIATISDTVADRGQRALLNGRQVVAFQIQRSKDSNEVTLGQEVARVISEMDRADNVEFALVMNRVKRIADDFDASMVMLFEGAFLAMLVVWLFLRDWRATLISALALPLSVIPTFAVIYWLGFSLNIITTLALTLVIGLLVDDTIVEVENIVRHLREGKPPIKAAMDAATEIGLAVVTTTMTLVAVFLPTAFMSGMAGQFFKEFGWTAATAVLASLAVARLITPMLCARFLQPHPQPPSGWIMVTYLDIARLALKHHLITSLCAALFFVGSVIALTTLPREFVPASDDSNTRVTVELAPGTPLATTNAMAELVRQKIAVIPEITNIFTTVGTGSSNSRRSPGVSDLRNATLTVDLIPIGQRERSQADIEVEIRSILRNLPGARFQVGSRKTGEILLINLTSEDAQLLHQTVKNVMTEIRGVSGLGNVSSNTSLLRPEIFIRPKLARAAELGVTASAIGETVQVATAGDYSAALAQMNLPQRQVDIRVQLPLATRQDLAAIEQLRVPGSHGLVPLAAVAEVSMGSGPGQISRFDRSRNVQIEIELGSLLLGDANALVRELPSLKRLPRGVSWVDTGDSKMMNDMFSDFGIAMTTGLICVFMVLVLLFKDFMQPITILAALPLTVGGAVVALFIVDGSFSLAAVIGLLMLMGIATKNSILLVDYAVVAMRNGMDVHDALLDSCAKRARPIVMTTLAMTAGMLPVAMGIHSGSSLRMPMGIVVIGGLLTSTVLSLIVVPVVFTYVLQAKEFLVRILPQGHTVETTP